MNKLSDIRNISIPLLKFYDQNARVLPWREAPSPYRIFVSEVMLQQTRVETVKPYFERFIAALPDFKALSAADEGKLLKLWEGLGYYSRAKNLQKAARIVVRDYGGELPSASEELKKLPGLGEYSSGAIASIAFNRRVCAVDGNVLRVFSRLLADESELGSPAFKSRVKALLYEILPGDRPGDFNQALMELGATVCLPGGAPLCEKCPVTGFCAAKRAGMESALPVKSKKPAHKIEKKTVALCLFENCVVLKKRPDRGLLAGLWEFVNIEGELTKPELIRHLSDIGLKPAGAAPLGPAEHIFTHIKWRMTGYLVSLESPPEPGVFVLAPLSALEKCYPIPSAFKKYRAALIK